jgi:hypothetical protein
VIVMRCCPSFIHVAVAALVVALPRAARADDAVDAEVDIEAVDDAVPLLLHLPFHIALRLGEPVELGRYRTPEGYHRYLALPIGEGRYCLLDPEGADSIKGNPTSVDQGLCVAIATSIGSAGAVTAVVVSTGGVGTIGSVWIGALGAACGASFGYALCPDPEAPRPAPLPLPYVPRIATPVSSAPSSPPGFGGIPCGCPDPGCGCGAGCACGCANGASCACGCSGGGVGP